jgi:hypothetical protein
MVRRTQMVIVQLGDLGYPYHPWHTVHYKEICIEQPQTKMKTIFLKLRSLTEEDVTKEERRSKGGGGEGKNVLKIKYNNQTRWG